MENYFELYQLPVSFGIDSSSVRRKFLELSRTFHPDRFAAADESIKSEALENSSVNNRAYQVLNDADLRMAYVLKQQGLLEEEEKYNLPPTFLMEMMELNEALDEGNMRLAQTTWNEAIASWNSSTNQLTARFDQGEQTEELLKKIKDFYFQKKYLLRIRERLDTFATS